VTESTTAVDEQLETLERELAEIDLLVQQTRDEAERHAQRLKETVDRLPAADPDSAALRSQLLALAQRATMMEGQVQVLEGKQKTLRRFVDFVTEVGPRLSAAGGVSQPAHGQGPSRAVLAAQEEMRREIARRMHDGPAQAIANIALQAQLVRRLAAQDPSGSQAELDRLGEMVQHALDATKGFIFEVRPMVLDDLGLVATLRRMASERARRSGVPVKFDSSGTDRRLPEEVESNLFRLVDDAVAGFIRGLPEEVSTRLDWSATELVVHVQSTPQTTPTASHGIEATVPQSDDVPPGLATVLEERREYEATKAAQALRASALPEDVWADIQFRAATLGITAELSSDGHKLFMTVGTPK
jgi:two-component system, NarL family, sensor histidine kinase DegS